MVQMQLSDEDATILFQALTVHLVELRREVAGTENPRFRHDLQGRLNMLERLVTELAGKGVGGARASTS